MKNIFIISFTALLLLLSCNKNSNKNIELINWETNYNRALEKAAKENKAIMIDFYTDWCTICKIMETNVYLDKNVASNINYNFVPLKINAEYNDENIKFLTNKYNISAFPTTVLINTNGFIIKKILGYIDTNDLLEEITNIEIKRENINREFANNNPSIEKLKIYIDSEYYKEAAEMYDVLIKENKIEKKKTYQHI
ncbi:thioredoxin family protein [Brachyspira sp. SAP_772]|uniref:thioredoxin family protein n=1 Tax=Brachyspira sp. SAP_772 TaxID=2608385 RepID=UPI001E29DFD6|nr:thioredoxin family protein [Brachyspira sp. SAP_772]